MEEFDKYAKDYDAGLTKVLESHSIIKNDLSVWAKYKIELTKYVLDNNKLFPNNILDFGCGIGRSFHFIKEYYPLSELYGCDVSKEEINIASSLYPDVNLFVNTDNACLKEFSERFNLIQIACVLHHIEINDREMWLKALWDTLKPDGVIAIFEHNMNNPITRKIVRDPVNYADKEENMLTNIELKNLFINMTDAEIIWNGYTLFSPFRCEGIVKYESFFRWLPLGAQQALFVRKRKKI